MKSPRIELVKPDSKYEKSYVEAFHEMQSDSDRAAWMYLGDSASFESIQKNFNAYVESLLSREQQAPVGFVRDSVYWAIQNNEIVGRIAIRHELNDFLKKVGGHVGYIVRPSARGKGIATEMLRMLLQTDKAKEVKNILLTCDEHNVASEKTIRNNNGFFESVVDVGPHTSRKKRFWIRL